MLIVPAVSTDPTACVCVMGCVFVWFGGGGAPQAFKTIESRNMDSDKDEVRFIDILLFVAVTSVTF
jgi:hypothetical protein